MKLTQKFSNAGPGTGTVGPGTGTIIPGTVDPAPQRDKSGLGPLPKATKPVGN